MTRATLVNFHAASWRANAAVIERELSDAIRAIGVVVAEVDQATLDVASVIEESNSYVSGFLNSGTYFELTGRNFLTAPNLLTARFTGAGDTLYIEGNFPYKADRGTVNKVELSDGSSSYSAAGDLQYVFGNSFAASISGTLKSLAFRSPEINLVLRGNLELRSDKIIGGSFSHIEIRYGNLDFSATGAIDYSDSLQVSLLNSASASIAVPIDPPVSSVSLYRVLNAGNGDEVFQGLTDRIDIVKVPSEYSNFSIQRFANTVVLVDNIDSNGIDTLVGIERIQFADKAIALDTEAVGGQAYRVYKAAFNREPDQGGLGYWIAQMDSGMNMVEVAARFIDSNEFRAMYGASPTDEQYLTKIYQNVLGRDPEPDGYNWWLNEMRTNPEKTRAKVLADFSESAENKAGTAQLVGQGIVYDPWVG
jgi:hypothetical protein